MGGRLQWLLFLLIIHITKNLMLRKDVQDALGERFLGAESWGAGLSVERQEAELGNQDREESETGVFEVPSCPRECWTAG